MTKIEHHYKKLRGVRLICGKMSRATGQDWVILKQDDLFHVMSYEQYDEMPDKDEFEFVELVTRVYKNVGK